jgi:hypothetical protein
VSRLQGHGTVERNVSLKNPVTPPGIDPGTVRLVAQRRNFIEGPIFVISDVCIDVLFCFKCIV